MKQTTIADVVRDFVATHEELMELLDCGEEKAWELAEEMCSERYDVDLTPLHEFIKK